MNFFITADRIGIETGGGLVTHNEHEAFQSMGSCKTYENKDLDWGGQEPWKWDNACHLSIHAFNHLDEETKTAHFYSGTFSRTVKLLKDNGYKITYTVAAHDREVSRREHEKIGLEFPYLHLKDNLLWQRYVEGYRLADVIVCPGSVPANTVRKYGPDFETKIIKVIPHGCNLPKEIKPIPKQFKVGYMGAIGPDKGLIYLLQAWKKLHYKDAILVLAGRDTASEFMLFLINKYGGGNVKVMGWVKDPSDFYNDISLYVQPSATEGFGLEVLEAMAHGRPVLCSDAAGAVDIVGHGRSFKSCDIDSLIERISYVRKESNLDLEGELNRATAERYSWDNIRQRYVNLWRTL